MKVRVIHDDGMSSGREHRGNHLEEVFEGVCFGFHTQVEAEVDARSQQRRGLSDAVIADENDSMHFTNPPVHHHFTVRHAGFDRPRPLPLS